MSAPAIFTDLNDVDRDGCMQEHKDEGGLAKHGVSIHEDTPWSLTSHPSRRVSTYPIESRYKSRKPGRS